jgi:hypothetical protein
MEPWAHPGDVEAQNCGLEAHNGAVEGLHAHTGVADLHRIDE